MERFLLRNGLWLVLPLLFVETDVRVLGKIIGVCRSGLNEHGRMNVEELSN